MSGDEKITFESELITEHRGAAARVLGLASKAFLLASLAASTTPPPRDAEMFLLLFSGMAMLLSYATSFTWWRGPGWLTIEGERLVVVRENVRSRIWLRAIESEKALRRLR
jgi:hypothetical protein